MAENPLIALAERCEAASGPDRELDELIADALFERSHFAQLKDAPIGTGCMMWWQDGHQQSALRYTASVDAAMTLVSNGSALDLSGPRRYLNIPTPAPNYWSAKIFTFDGSGPHIKWGATPALAICAAALRAIAENQP